MLSSPPCFRIQGGSPERDTVAVAVVAGVVVVAGQYFPFLILGLIPFTLKTDRQLTIRKYKAGETSHT